VKILKRWTACQNCFGEVHSSLDMVCGFRHLRILVFLLSTLGLVPWNNLNSMWTLSFTLNLPAAELWHYKFHQVAQGEQSHDELTSHFIGCLTENKLKDCRASHGEFNWTFHGVSKGKYAEIFLSWVSQSIVWILYQSYHWKYLRCFVGRLVGIIFFFFCRTRWLMPPDVPQPVRLIVLTLL
jgi:hypothetical protein